MNIVNALPDDLLQIIWSYLNPIKKIFLNKTYYNKYNYLIDKLIINYQSYIRDIIRVDYQFIFNYILLRNFDKWIKPKNYQYGNIIYPSYIDYIHQYAKNNKSNKCVNLINLNLQISKLKKLSCKDYRRKKKLWIL